MGLRLGAILVACAGALGGCIPSTSPEALREAGLVRDVRDVQLAPGDTIEVSALVREGSGTPIVYVHGTPGDAAAFFDYLTMPIGGHTSISIDRPGFGETTPERVVSSYDEQARAVLAWCDAPSVLVGHSLGGPIIARAAADAPEKVAALVILSGSLDPELEIPRWYNHVVDGPLGALFPRSLRNSNAEIMDAPAEAVALAEVLDRVTCPVVIVHGGRDTLVPVENVGFMQRAFTNARAVETVLLPRAKHMIVWTDEEACREAIARALELVEGEG